MLLDDDALERSSVVANSAMNRDRALAGYDRELGLDIVAAAPARWLDLCCGSGRALLEAAPLLPRTRIVGVDLVDHFVTAARPPHLSLVTASLTTWTPDAPFDLITCVHGLHYIGDKLALLTRAASWLTETGTFAASFHAGGVKAPGRFGTVLREQGFEYDTRRRRVSLAGRRDVAFPYRYLGADDRSGPNYTGQPAVTSHYARRA
ncbi:class I SAM-dependent methyltransferase [Spirillospora sp. NPDC047279]|uniref:class I SAM-dependent methyltransferase n=1 Tax=Spirillospora sp. NPDC047279 TaxID=3155478 RepID=UPI0033E50EFF